MIAISDPRVKAVPIIESGEKTVDIRYWQIEDSLKSRRSDPDFYNRLTLLPDPTKKFESPDHNAGFVESGIVRQSVFDRLKRALLFFDANGEEYGFIPGQIGIKVFEGLRSIETQRTLFENKLDEIRSNNPEWSLEELTLETGKWVSPVVNNVPPHSTGAAVDIRLWDTIYNEFIDLGKFGVIWGPNPEAVTVSTLITDQQRENRKFLVECMSDAGFVNYDYEWWHFSYGDQYWGYMKGKSAMYGAPC